MEILPQDLSKNFHPVKSFLSNFKKINLLGKGSFGEVFTAEEIKTGEVFAVKQISLHKKKVKYENIITEIHLLKQVNHPNIVKYYNYYEDDDNIYIIMEYLSGNTLQNFIDEHKTEKITEEISRIIIIQILNALNYLHYSCDICHRDIKPENVLFKNKDDINSLKIIDFGLSSGSFEQKEYLNKCGTLSFMAPEQITNLVYSKGIDIWSTGIILYMLLNNGKHPFYKKGDTRENVIHKITSEELKLDENCSISEIGKNLIRKLLTKNPAHRYTARPALIHPWITMRKYDKIPLATCDKFLVDQYKKKLSNILLTSLFIKHYKNNDKNNKIITSVNFGTKTEFNIPGNSSFDLNEYEKRVIKTNLLYEQKFRKYRDSLFLDKNSKNEKNEENIDNENFQIEHIPENKNSKNSLKSNRSKSQNDYSFIDNILVRPTEKYVNSKGSKRYLIKNNNASRNIKKIIIEARNISKEKNKKIRSTQLLPSSSVKNMIIKLIDGNKIVFPYQIKSSKFLNFSINHNDNKLRQCKSPLDINKTNNNFVFELNPTYSMKLIANFEKLKNKLVKKIKPKALFHKNVPILPRIEN